MQYIPLVMVLLASLITLTIGLVKKFEIIFCLKILSIVIILFYIIGNIVKKLLGLIIDMEKVDEEAKDNNEEETTEDGRADEQIITSDKSGDDFEE
jgi:hypothetical protein